MNKLQQIERDEAHEKKSIQAFFSFKNTGIFVEVGANEPTAIESQTWHLEQLGWRGILVEPIPELAQKARQTRPQSQVFQVACGAQAEEVEFLVPKDESQQLVTGHASLYANIDEHHYSQFHTLRVQKMTLDSILESAQIKTIDLLSIDVEGAELEVLQGINLAHYQPRLILLEDKHLYLAKHFYLMRHGYKIVRRLNRNCWYIPQAHQSPLIPVMERVRLYKRMFISIWLRKLQYALRHRTIKSFCTL